MILLQSVFVLYHLSTFTKKVLWSVASVHLFVRLSSLLQLVRKIRRRVTTEEQTDGLTLPIAIPRGKDSSVRWDAVNYGEL